MLPAAHPDNEDLRIAKLVSLGVLDTLPQKAFDDITALASAICGTPIALISLVDSERQWFKSRVGLEAQQTSREVAFCSHAILNPADLFVVEDAALDPRFADNPLVTDRPDIRFYAGAPIVTSEGYALGTVCVIDQKPRQLNGIQLQALRSLSSLVSTLLAHQKLVQDQHDRATAEVFDRNEYLAALTASGLDLMSFVDTDYVYRYVNNTYLTYWERQANEIVGKSVAELMSKEVFFDTVKPHFDQALAGEQAHYEATIEFPGVGPRHVEISYLPARDEEGTITGVVVRAHDIQALQQREEELRHTVAMLEHKTLEQERFIHIISHDLREPINTINNFTSLLTGDTELKLPNHAQRYLGFVASGGERMRTLVDDLLGFMQLERHAVTKRRVDLTKLAAEVRDDLAATLGTTNGRIEFGHLPIAYGDPSLLRIALQNLMSNGLKFTADGKDPVVKVDAAIHNDLLKVSVQDNGIGMAPDQIHRIFEMFQRLHTRKKYAGSGLGLSICRRVAELHGGEISVSSEPGVGSCFTLTLPILPIPIEERDGHEYL